MGYRRRLFCSGQRGTKFGARQIASINCTYKLTTIATFDNPTLPLAVPIGHPCL
jgi:hypothetical protein